MEHLTPHEMIRVFLTLGLLLGSARVLGEFATRLGQPSILGELLAGILLGPTVMGELAPVWEDFFFPRQGPRFVFLEGFAGVSVVLFLFVAGMEVDLSTIWRQGKRASTVSVMGIAFPFVVGFGVAWLFPGLLLEQPPGNHLAFALFMGVALAISALPVIIKTLMDLKLYRGDFGMLVTAAATFDDLIGWIGFSLVLGLLGSESGDGQNHSLFTVIHTLGFAAFILTVVRWVMNRSLPWVLANTTWPGGVMSLSLVAALFGAAYAEWIGIHPVFGAFLMGIAIGDSPHMREHTKMVLQQFIAFIFAPIFFATIGLRVNFVANFDLTLAVVVFFIATVGKLLGCGVAGLLTGLSQRESWALGAAMNSRGIMEIILGLVALEHGLIDERLFVALVIMSVGTSMLSGPLVGWLLRRRKIRRILDFFKPRAYVPALQGRTAEQVIGELSDALARATGMDRTLIERAVLEREATMSTGIENRIAIPHAHLPELKAPAIACGISSSGCDFDAPDGNLAQVVFLILTPEKDTRAMLELLADIGETFQGEAARQAAVRTTSANELIALLKSGG